MARPTTVEILGGTVVIKNLSKENTDELKEYIQKFESREKKPLLTAEQAIQLLDMPCDSSSVAGRVAMITELMGNEEEQTYTDETYSMQLNNPMTDEALGFRKNSSGFFEIVTVKYNDTKAMVDNIRTCGKDTRVAQSDFRMVVSKKFL